MAETHGMFRIWHALDQILQPGVQIFSCSCNNIRLAAELRPEPTGELTTPHAGVSGEGKRGKGKGEIPLPLLF